MFSFRTFASARADKTGKRVLAWWSANLDEDAKLESVAVLCPREHDDDIDHSCEYVVEKDPAHRWEIRFSGYRNGPDCGDDAEECVPGPSGPHWHHRSKPTIEHDWIHVGEGEVTEFALRGGVPVVLRVELGSITGDTRWKSKQKIDYEVRARTKHRKYPAFDEAGISWFDLVLERID